MAERSMLTGVPLEEFSASTNVMIYGPPGSGKTSLAGTAPKALFWGFEPGVKAAKRRGSKAKVVMVSNWDQAWKMLLEAEAGKTGGHEWYLFDTVTSFENKVMRSILDEDHEENPAKRSEYIPGVDQHQERQNKLKRFVERMIDLPVNTLWLAHEMRVENEEGDTLLLPSISGGADKGYPVANYIMGLMDAVGYCAWATDTAERTQRVVWQHTTITKKRTTTIYTAKDQFNAFGAWTDNWNMGNIIGAIGAPSPRVPRAIESQAEEAADDAEPDQTDEVPAQRRTTRRAARR